MARIDVEVIISAVDNASAKLRSFGDNAESAHRKFGDLVAASTAASFAFAGALALTGKSIIDVASDMQQAKVGFTTMLGSADMATKTLKELSDFAKKTPFTFPSIVEASQRLLAYNVEAKDLIPTLTTLGNIASGVGMEKMPQLILAFGQVKAATRLTGMELRQFSEAGVPLLQALVDQANKAGGVLTTVGGTSSKTREKIDDLNATLQKQTNRFTEMSGAGKTSSATYKNLEISIGETKEKLASLGPVSDGVTKRVKVTAEQMKDMISDGTVSFAQVQAALESIGGAQGKWGDLMDKQSQTFAGRMSNISDQLIRIALNVAGISTAAENFGSVIEGGAFDRLSDGAQKVLDVLNVLEPKIKGFIESFLANQAAIGAVLGALAGGLLAATIALIGFLAPFLILVAAGAAVGAAIAFVIANFDQLWPYLLGITAALSALALVITATVMPAFIAWATTAVAGAIATAIALAPILIPIALIGIAVTALALAWKNNWFGIREIVENVVAFFKGTVMPFFQNEFVRKIIDGVMAIAGVFIPQFLAIRSVVEGVVGAISSLINKAQELANRVKGGLKIPGFQAGGIVPGPIGEPKMIMAHGGEEVVPNGKSGGGFGGNGGLVFNVNVGMYAGSEIDKRNIASDLYAALLKVAKAQNKSVAEMMGG